MQIKKTAMLLMVVSLLMSIALGSCKKCNTCMNQCAKVYLHPPGPDSIWFVISYDTFCSENFPNYQVYLDSLYYSSRYSIASGATYSTKSFSSCGASAAEIQTSTCY